MDSKIIKLSILIFFLIIKVNAAEFNGKFIQGHFIIGKTDPNSKVIIDKTKVKFLVDEDIINGKFERVYFHPLVNTATTGISCDDFKRFVTLTGHGISSVTLV